VNSPLLPTYARADVAFERGEGPWLMTRDGERYLDFGGGIAVNVLGHAHPHLVAALTEQAGKLWHTSNLFRIPEGERLAQRLVDNTFADLVFFTNSGAEALEASIKMARKYHSANGEPERFRILTFEGAFHGRTLATIAAGGQKKYLEGFGPKVEGFDQVPFGDHEALRRAITPETGAILIEPVQGEGGIRNVPTQCLRGLRELCDEHGMLLVFDEVQTGVGRTGTFFAWEQLGVRPDLVTLAKGLANGLPLGCLLVADGHVDVLAPGDHGSTFGGNPVSCAAACAVVDAVDETLLAHVATQGGRLAAALAAFPAVRTVRGAGLLVGAVLDRPVAPVVDACRDAGLVVLTAGEDVLRLAPPLTVSAEEIDLALDVLAGVLA
jgi:acetylornithine/N-succinyldiaminopimelate aminotransferase